MQKYIVVNLIYAATHNWPACNIEEVAYLKAEHRHQFYIECIKEVSHNERDIEIIRFKAGIEAFLAAYDGKLGGMSCETLAEILINNFNLKACKILEDNENGAYLIND